MKAINYIAIVLMAASSISAASAANRHHAPHIYRGFCHGAVMAHPAQVVVTHTRPAVVKRVTNRFDRNDRLEMAMAYLRSNKSINAGQYAKITGLDKPVAEAELDAFSASRSNPITMVIDGRKKVYVIV